MSFRRHLRLQLTLSCLQGICFSLGAGFLALFVSARVAAEVGREQGIASFTRATLIQDRSLWSAERVNQYEASKSAEIEPIAVLRVPALKLEVPVFPSVSELYLNRGAGLIAGMGSPEEGGNVGIAGHRDGFFRVLKDIKAGDRIELHTRTGVNSYRVTDTKIVESSDLRPLADTEDPAVTLVTCFPFYFVGRAPQRFIVHATYEWTPHDSPEHLQERT